MFHNICTKCLIFVLTVLVVEKKKVESTFSGFSLFLHENSLDNCMYYVTRKVEFYLVHI